MINIVILFVLIKNILRNVFCNKCLVLLLLQEKLIEINIIKNKKILVYLYRIAPNCHYEKLNDLDNVLKHEQMCICLVHFNVHLPCLSEWVNIVTYTGVDFWWRGGWHSTAFGFTYLPSMLNQCVKLFKHVKKLF